MKKIITLYQRNHNTDHLVRNEVTLGAEWVLAGEGVATCKHDGTCCMIRNGKLYKRHEVKRGKKIPDGFEAAQEADPITGATPGWVLVGSGPEDRWHREAFSTQPVWPDGTYELCGPKIQGNPEKLATHALIPHGGVLLDAPREFDLLREWFRSQEIEGVVWHHPDGRMVKIKRRDFYR